MTSRKPTLRSPQFTQRISLQQYQEEAEDYTRQQLHDLAEYIRRNKQVATKTKQYVVAQRPFHIRSSLIKLGVQSIIVYIVFLFIANSSATETDLLTAMQNFYCPSELKDFIKPPVVLAISIGNFILWIYQMNLENLFIQRKANFPSQFFRVLLQQSFSLLLWIMIATWTALLVRFINIRGECMKETSSVVNTLLSTEISKEFFLGIALPVAKALSSVSPSLQTIFTIAISLQVIQGLLGTLVRLKERKSQLQILLLIVTVGILYYFVADSFLGRRGEWFLVSYCLIQMQSTVAEIIQNEMRNPNKEQNENRIDPDLKEFLDEELEEEEDDDNQ